MNLKINFKLFIFSLIISAYACDQGIDSMNDPDPDPIDISLSTKTITISQVIDGIEQIRPVIIQAPSVINPAGPISRLYIDNDAPISPKNCPAC